jgi:hypothetical protein
MVFVMYNPFKRLYPERESKKITGKEKSLVAGNLLVQP